jgi:hypothetical protein
MRQTKYLRGQTGTVACTKVPLYTDTSLAWTADSSSNLMCTGGSPKTWNAMVRKRERKKGQAGNASGQGKTFVVGSNASPKITTHTAQVCPFFITSFA